MSQTPLPDWYSEDEGKHSRYTVDRTKIASSVPSGLQARSDEVLWQSVKIENLSVERISPTLEKIVAGSLRRAPTGQAPLLAWPLACGSAVAARTTALSFEKSILRVEVPDAGWRAELRHLAPQYLAVINRYSNSPISKIEFVIRPARSCA